MTKDNIVFGLLSLALIIMIVLRVTTWFILPWWIILAPVWVPVVTIFLMFALLASANWR